MSGTSPGAHNQAFGGEGDGNAQADTVVVEPQPSETAESAGATAVAESASPAPSKSNDARDFLRSREKQYAANVEEMHKAHQLDQHTKAVQAAAAAVGEASAEKSPPLLKQFRVKIALHNLVSLKEFVGWGEDYPFDIPKAPDALLRRLVASLNFYGSNYFVVIAAA